VNENTALGIKQRFKVEYEKLRIDHENRRQQKNYIKLEEARANRVKVDWDAIQITEPTFIGAKSFIDYPLAEIRKYIDWTPFFQTWMLAGRYPGILEDKVVGEEATKLFKDAQEMLDLIIKERSLHANGVVAFYPAQSAGDDVMLFRHKEDDAPFIEFQFLRQQNKKAEGLPNFCLADFIAPEELGKKDYVGMFAVTAGVGLEEFVERFKNADDDYSEILVKALADRLAEAFAECLHAKVRRELWGYAKDETLSNEELIKEKYQGIRPAPGYPACPDHTEKRKIFDLLDAEKETGIRLTESFAMYPASSISGYYFSNENSKYYGLGKIEKDQVEDYARRKGMSVQEIERWLSPNLSYEIS
jgi:5-methyltetrahydrofolate--homocysteine methyltransferase